ncbi:MAG: FAD-binding oxidoreductase [Myxococcales bacterium]|nr:FAD-binding oxidoreductase [Myxococcales bacterium]
MSGWGRAALCLPPAPSQLSADLLVVGLGGTGLAAVHEGLDLGLSVVGLDARRVADGAAGKNGGFLLAGLSSFHHDAVERYGRAEAATWYRLSLSVRDDIVRRTPAAVRRVGSLRRALDEVEEADARELLEALRADGFDAAWVDEPDGRGVLTPGDATFHPVARARALAWSALRRGAQLFERSPVTSVSEGLVHTASGVVRARHVVVATDGALQSFLPDAPATAVRLQMLKTGPVAQGVVRRAVYARYGYDYWQQSADGCIYVGGGRHLNPAAEATHDETPSDEIQRHLDHVLRDLLHVEAPVSDRWASVVTYSQDGLPIARRLGSSIAVLGAYNGTGNVIGAMLGRAAVRALVERRTPPALGLTGWPDGP